MKTHLLKKIIFVFALFAATTMSAQSYTFDTDLQGWAQGFAVSAGVNNGTVSYAPTGGQSTGALKLERLTANANIGCPVPIDGTTFKYIKIRYKNDSASSSIRVQGTSASGALGQVVYNITPGTGVGTGEWSTAYIDMSAAANWSASVTSLYILFRGALGTATTEVPIYIDSIDFLASIPPTEYSEFLQNPNFEDPTGVGFYTGAGATRSISSVAQAGSQSMKNSFTAAQTSNFWNFSGYKKVYAPGVLTGKTAVVKIWVKTNRTTAAQINVKLKTVDATNTVTANQPQVTQLTTNFSGGWEELTFNLPLLDSNVEGITFFLGVNWNDPTVTPDNSVYNAVSGNDFYFDTMSATFITTPLSTNQNNLAGISIYPNPATDVVNVNSPNGGLIAVYNTLGAKVISAEATSSNHQLNVSGLTKGMYLLELTSEGKTAISKIIIK